MAHGSPRDESVRLADLLPVVSTLRAVGPAPKNALESGIVTALPPGAFTVILAGPSDGTGVGLVEIYNVK